MNLKLKEQNCAGEAIPLMLTSPVLKIDVFTKPLDILSAQID